MSDWVVYEWDVEELEDGEIVDRHCHEGLNEVSAGWWEELRHGRASLSLVRDDYRPCGDRLRAEANVVDGKLVLPEYFEGSARKIPKRYHEALAAGQRQGPAPRTAQPRKEN